MIDHIAVRGNDNGAPGLRQRYRAFVLDPDGNNVEPVCRTSA
jgi:hypothetical protein